MRVLNFGAFVPLIMWAWSQLTKLKALLGNPIGGKWPNWREYAFCRNCTRWARPVICHIGGGSCTEGAPPNDMNKKLGRLAVDLAIILFLSLVALFALHISDQQDSAQYLAAAGGILAAIRIFHILTA